MGCSFQAKLLLLAIFIIAQPTLARAADFCQARDDKAEVEAVDKFFESTLREHGQQAYSRTLKTQAKAKAKALLEQNILDKKTQICADHLKLAEDVRNEPKHWATADCSSAAVVSLVDGYMRKVAQAYDENQKAMATQQREHLQDLKLRLFEIAKGSTTGVDQAVANAPKNTKFEWIKQQATKLASEAHRAWGGVDPEKNPLVQQNLGIAREAVRAKGQRDALKTQFRTDGRLAASCVRKP